MADAVWRQVPLPIGLGLVNSRGSKPASRPRRVVIVLGLHLRYGARRALARWVPLVSILLTASFEPLRLI